MYVYCLINRPDWFQNEGKFISIDRAALYHSLSLSYKKSSNCLLLPSRCIQFKWVKFDSRHANHLDVARFLYSKIVVILSFLLERITTLVWIIHRVLYELTSVLRKGNSYDASRMWFERAIWISSTWYMNWNNLIWICDVLSRILNARALQNIKKLQFSYTLWGCGFSVLLEGTGA